MLRWWVLVHCGHHQSSDACQLLLNLVASHNYIGEQRFSYWRFLAKFRPEKNMISTYTKDFSWKKKHGQKFPDIEEKQFLITRFL